MTRKRHRRRARELNKLKQEQSCVQQFDLPNETSKSGEKPPVCHLISSHQSSQQIPPGSEQATRKGGDVISFERVTASPCMSEQPTLQKQFSSEKSDPHTNQNSSQITHAKDDPREDSITQGRKRRKRRRRGKPVLQMKQPTRESVYSDRTVANPTESFQSPEPQTYYAIRDGAFGHNGVHTDWNLCVRYLKGTCGATFKSFSTLDEAFTFAHRDVSAEPSRPRKKLKRDTRSQAKNDTNRAPEKDSRYIEGIGSSRGLQDPDHSHCPDGPVARNDPPLQNDPAPQGDGAPKDGQPPESVEPPKEIEPSKVIRSPEDVRVQPWKVEPVLLPSSLFSAQDDTAIKGEELLIPVEPIRVPF